MNSNPPAFSLTDLRQGLHDDTLRELAAKSVGWQWYPDERNGLFGFWAKGDNYTNWGNTSQKTELLPAWHKSLDSCRELLESLTEEEWEEFCVCLLISNENHKYDLGKRYLLSSARDQLIAFCLTRKLIQLKQNES